LKILHVWDQAGVSACMAKYQRKLGHEADVVKLGHWDGKGIDEYYHTDMTFEPQKARIYKTAKAKLPKSKKIRRFLYKFWNAYPTAKLYYYVFTHAKQYDFIHIHGIIGLAILPLFKPKIIEFHGDDIRTKPTMYGKLHKLKVNLFMKLYRKKFYVSTPDMLTEFPKAEWIPNPVDTDHFKPTNHNPIKNEALYARNWYESGEHAEAICQKYNLKITVLRRDLNDWIDYKEFPEYLSQFEYYITRKEIPSMCKTGLEALAEGLTVIQGWDEQFVRGLPECHLPDNVARNTIQIYEQVMKK